MAERNMLFTWDLQSFNENLNQSSDLLSLRIEFEMKNFPLSRSLLIWEKSENWSLVDFENEKVYHIEINNNEVEISEEIGGWQSIDTGLIKSLSLHGLYGTHEGFVDWLLTLVKFRVVTFDQSGLDSLKRADLSGRKLSFKTVHPDLLAAYEMLREILTAPRESLIGLSRDNIQQIRSCLQQMLGIFQEIHNFDLQNSSEAQNVREEHKRISQDIVSFCDTVKQQLGSTVAFVQSKRAEQLETQVTATVDNTLADAKEKLNANTNRSQKQNNQAEQNETKRQEEFNQLKSQLQDLLAKESVAEYGRIFDEQANKHQRAAFWWLVSTVGLSIGFGCIFVWLFNVLRLGGTEWVGILQNIFTKGFLLSLIYLLLNRSIKNYTAQKHLEVINRHRQNALDTFERFVSSAARQETKEEVLIAATNAIFDANQTGYLSTKMRGSESTNPIPQVIKAVMPSSSSTRSE